MIPTMTYLSLILGQTRQAPPSNPGLPGAGHPPSSVETLIGFLAQLPQGLSSEAPITTFGLVPYDQTQVS